MVRWQMGGQRLTDGAFRSELHLIDTPVGLGWRIADLLQRTVKFPRESDVTLVYRPRLLDPGPELGQLFRLVSCLLRLGIQSSLQLRDLLLQSLRFLEPLLDQRPERREFTDLVQRPQESPWRQRAEAEQDLDDPLQHAHHFTRAGVLAPPDGPARCHGCISSGGQV